MRADVFYLTGHEPLIARIVHRTFPDYTGRTFVLHITDGPVDVYVPMGDPTEFCFVDLKTLEVSRVLEDRDEGRRRKTKPPVRLPTGIVAVERRYARGIDRGIVVYVRAADVRDTPGLQPTPVTLTREEEIVLRYTANHAASYGGNVRYRQFLARRDTGITEEEWNTARDALKAKRLIAPNNSIMRQGRNLVK